MSAAIRAALITLTSVIIFLSAPSAQAQPAHGGILQFTGMVVQGDSLEGIPSVSVRIPKSNRSTTTDEHGFFSLPVLLGDSVVIRSLHFTQYVLIPTSYPSQSYSALIQLDNSPGKQSKAHLVHTNKNFQQEFMKLKLPDTPHVSVQEDYDHAFIKMIFNQIVHKK